MRWIIKLLVLNFKEIKEGKEKLKLWKGNDQGKVPLKTMSSRCERLIKKINFKNNILKN